MIWQDTVIAICQTGFIIALVPSVFGKDKPALITSAISAILVAIIAFSLFTLQLWFAAATAGIICLAWTTLAVQKLKLNNQKVLNSVREKPAYRTGRPTRDG